MRYIAINRFDEKQKRYRCIVNKQVEAQYFFNLILQNNLQS